MEEDDDEDVDSEASGSDDDNMSCMYMLLSYILYSILSNKCVFYFICILRETLRWFFYVQN